MPLAHKLSFFRRYLSSPDVTGALAPSSRRLAAEMVRPFAARTKPSKVLEIGAGTGPFTRAIGELLGPQDHFDVCELQPDLADILERDVLSDGTLAEARREGRVRLIRGPVEEIDAPNTYDYVICGLPFTAFNVGQVRRIMRVIERNMKPDGTFSYFEDLAMRRLTCAVGYVTGKRRARRVSRYLNNMIGLHQKARKTVWINLPPAYSRHWSFNDKGESAIDKGGTAKTS
jgi:phospholipid N-methyltransferase